MLNDRLWDIWLKGYSTTLRYYIQTQLKFAGESRHPTLMKLPIQEHVRDFQSLSKREKSIWTHWAKDSGA